MDAKPGLNMMILDMLKRRKEEDPAKYGCVCLMLDAIAIKQHIQYNPLTQQMSEFVFMGDGINEADVATEALVFLVVLEGSKCLIPYQVPFARDTGSSTRSCVGGTACMQHKSGMCHNGWECLQCVHVQPTWVPAKGKSC